jgi:hypothetical protein
VLPVPDSEHNEALDGDTLFNVSFNFEWRRLIVQELSVSMSRIAATIDDDSEREIFENRVGVMLQDFYDEEIVPATIKEVWKNNTQALTANADTIILWNQGPHDSPNGGRVSFASDGIAFITANFNVTSAIACQCTSWVEVNGVQYGREDADATRLSHFRSPVFVLAVVAGQYVELHVQASQAATVATATIFPRINVVLMPSG